MTWCNSSPFVYLPTVSFYTTQTTCMESIQTKVKDVKYIYLSLVKVTESRHFGNRHFGTVDILGVDILAQ